MKIVLIVAGIIILLVLWVIFLGWILSVLVNILLPSTNMTHLQGIALAVLISFVGGSFRTVHLDNSK